MTDDPATRKEIHDLVVEFGHVRGRSPRRAREVAERAVSLSRGVSKQTFMAASLHALAGTEFDRGNLVRSIELLEESARVARSGGFVTVEAEALLHRNHLLLFQGKLAGLEKSTARIRRAMRRAESPNLAARSLTTMGAIKLQRGEYPQAIRLFRKAIEEFRPLDAEAAEWLCKEGLATALIDDGKYEEGIAILRERIERSRRAANPRREAVACHNLFTAYLRAGRWFEAYREYERVLPLLLEHDPKVLIAHDADHAELSINLGLMEEAVAAATRSLERAEDLGFAIYTGRARLLRATARAQLDPPDWNGALDDLEWAEEYFEANDLAVAAADARLKRGFLALDRGNHADAAEIAERLVGETAVAGRVRAQAHELAARSALALGRPEDALAASRRAARLLSRLPLPWFREEVWCTRGKIHRRLGRTDWARRALERSLSYAELSETLAVSEPLTRSFLHRRMELYEELIDLIVSADALDPVDLFAAIDRGRARSFRRALDAPDRGSRRRGRGTSARDETDRAQLQQLYRRLARSTDHGEALSTQESRTIADEIREREKSIASRLRIRPTRSQKDGPLPSLELSDIQSELPDDAALVEFFSVRDRLSAFSVRRNSTELVSDLGSVRAIRAEAGKLRFVVGSAAPRSPSDRGDPMEPILSGLRDLLRPAWQGAGRASSAPLRTLYVVPHRALFQLPLSVLLGTDETRVSILPARAFLGMRERPPAGRPRAVGFAPEPEAFPHSVRELRCLERLGISRNLRRGGRASRREFLRLAPKADVLHLAGHAIYRQDNPAFSAFQLSDGLITAHEVAELSLRAATVVLAACESGRTVGLPGDEIVGLPRAFFLAGARSLVVHLWSVRDEVASRHTEALYRHLKRGETIDEACRLARHELRDEYGRAADWAGVQLLGDGRGALRPRP